MKKLNKVTNPLKSGAAHSFNAVTAVAAAVGYGTTKATGKSLTGISRVTGISGDTCLRAASRCKERVSIDRARRAEVRLAAARVRYEKAERRADEAAEAAELAYARQQERAAEKELVASRKEAEAAERAAHAEAVAEDEEHAEAFGPQPQPHPVG